MHLHMPVTCTNRYPSADGPCTSPNPQSIGSTNRCRDDMLVSAETGHVEGVHDKLGRKV